MDHNVQQNTRLKCVLADLTDRFGGSYWFLNLTRHLYDEKDYICGSFEEPWFGILTKDGARVIHNNRAIQALPRLEPGRVDISRLLQRAVVSVTDGMWICRNTRLANSELDCVSISLSCLVLYADIVMFSFNYLDDWKSQYRRDMPWIHRIFDFLDVKRRQQIWLQSRNTESGNFSHIVTCSSRLAKQIEDQYGISANQITALPSGVESRLFNSDNRPMLRSIGRRKYGFNEKDIVVLFPTISPERKGIHKVIRSISALKNPNVKLWLVGISEFSDHIRGLFTEYGMHKSAVVFTPPVPLMQLPEIYSSSDIMIMCPDSDYSPIVVNQSIACGTPGVITESSGASDYLRHEKDGFVCKLDNEVIDIIHYLACLIDNPELRQRFGESGAYHAKMDLSWIAFSRRLNDIVCAVKDSKERPSQRLKGMI